jgi:hypothetical protein
MAGRHHSDITGFQVELGAVCHHHVLPSRKDHLEVVALSTLGADHRLDVL